jgi:hypothetical protein
MPKSKKSKSSEDKKSKASGDPLASPPAKKPRGRPKGSRNKTTTTLIPDSEAMELGIAAAHALSMPANAAGFAATLGMPSLPASLAAHGADDELRPIDRGDMPKEKETRLEQNRKAARESRRRKKVMIEELQRSVIFFSRANATLKTQNEEFQRLLVQAQAQIAQMEATGEVPKSISGGDVATGGEGADGAPDATAEADAAPVDTQAAQQAVAAAQAAQQGIQYLQAQAAAQANAAAMQASFESQGYPPAAARAAARTFSAAGDGSGAAAPAAQGMDPQAMMQMWMQAMAQAGGGGGAPASAPADADNANV